MKKWLQIYILVGIALLLIIYLWKGPKAALAFWSIPGLPPPP